MLGVHRQQLRDNSTAVSKERWSPEPRPCKRTGDPAVPHPFCWGQRVPFCTGERRTTPQRGSSSRCGAGLSAGRKAPSAPPGARRAAPALPAAASRGRCEPAQRRAADRQQRPLSLAPLGTGCTFLTARPSVTFQSFQANDS